MYFQLLSFTECGPFKFLVNINWLASDIHDKLVIPLTCSLVCYPKPNIFLSNCVFSMAMHLYSM